MLIRWFQIWSFLMFYMLGICSAMITDFSKERIIEYREKVRSMFYHAYNSYLEHAYPLDELRPLTCKGMDTWGSFSLTLIDALDTLIIMGNHTEFLRAVDLVLKNADTDANVNVSVFETNIRVVGGLLSAHILSGRVTEMEKHPGYPCKGELLDLAEKFARKLLPAFNTETGMPYGTVNLRYGVHKYETPITCTAGVGTFIIEFGTLSRLTGNPIYERVALRAMKALWKTRSEIGLVGNHINVNTGVWTATDAGIGAGVDSYFEYLAKGALLLQRPLLMQQFYEYEEKINKYIRKEDWFMWVSMTKGQINFPVFQSLEAFYPGILALIGKVEDAARIMLTYDQVNRQYGVPPEFYNLPNREASNKRAGYPLRPEIVESMMYLYKATDDPHYLHMAASIVEAIEFNSKTSCGYATIQDLVTKNLEDRMESFFLSETTKYLYLIFDPDNFMHNDGSTGRVINHPSGKCVIYSGGWIFNTEAHPIDPGTLYCCSAKRQTDDEYLQRFKDSIDFVSLLDLTDPFLNNQTNQLDKDDLTVETHELASEDTTQSQAKEELEYYEKSWNDNKTDAGTDSTKSAEDDENNVESEEQEETQPEPLIEKPAQAIVPAVVEATEKPSKQRRERTKRKRNRQNKKAKSASELNSRKIVKEQIQSLIQELNEIDQKAGAKVDPNNLLKLLGELGSDYSGVLKATERLQRIALSKRPTDYAALKKSLIRRKIVSAIPINEVLCENCCVLLDGQHESVALRSMLNIIYSKNYPKYGLDYLPGPICRLWDQPDIRRNYTSAIPDVNLLEPENQFLDGVDEYLFATFAYRKLAAEHQHLLSSSPRPFESLLQGLGQVLMGPFMSRRICTTTERIFKHYFSTNQPKLPNVNSFSLRTHTCGELRLANEGEQVKLYGWLSFKRMNRFLVLRDAYGSVQVTIPDDKLESFSGIIRQLPYESSIKVIGTVKDRGADRNSKMETGDIEVIADDLEVLNRAPDVPKLIAKVDAAEQTRLANRHLDLRSKRMQSNLRLRSNVVHRMRKTLVEDNGFVEVETPTLAQWTPGGAHEFPVPCAKPHQGLFYSLPQSPQIFKQILMCGGIDRYFQMARCYRDEGAKSDRQPEFTQVDLEVSFTTQDQVLNLIESLIVNSWPEELKDLQPSAPFQRLTYNDVMRDYGVDKPDLRIPWKLFDCTDDFKNTPIGLKDDGWTAVCFIARNAAKSVTRSMRNEWKRLLGMKDSTNQKFAISNTDKKNLSKQFVPDKFIEKYSIGSKDLLVVSWGFNNQHIRETLGQLRNYIADVIGIRAEKRFEWAWILDFPLFLRNENGQLESAHHPFTAPTPEFLPDLLESNNLESLKAQHYDLVMNGIELGGGSVRIHNADLQKHVLNILNLPLTPLAKFIEALENGAPPHAGFALGLDRYIALLAEQGNSKASIRDVIAFPKTKEGKCLMMESPARPPQDILDRYGIQVKENSEKS